MVILRSATWLLSGNQVAEPLGVTSSPLSQRCPFSVSSLLMPAAGTHPSFDLGSVFRGTQTKMQSNICEGGNKTGKGVRSLFK